MVKLTEILGKFHPLRQGGNKSKIMLDLKFRFLYCQQCDLELVIMLNYWFVFRVPVVR